MPRINIEERWWSDPRRIKLNIRLGEGTADGVFLIATRLSQDYNGEAFDARKSLDPEWIAALLKSGLASGSPEAFLVAGAEKHHEWIKKQRDSASKGGRATKRKINELQEATAERVLGHAAASAGPSPSTSPSYNSLATSSNSPKNIPAQETFAGPPKGESRKETILGIEERRLIKSAWINLYQQNLGVEYQLSNSASFNTIIKKIHTTLGLEKSLMFMEKYLRWTGDPWITKRCHPLENLLGSIQAVQAQESNPKELMRRVAVGEAERKFLTDEEKSLHMLRRIDEEKGNKNERIKGLATSVPRTQTKLVQDKGPGILPGQSGGPFLRELRPVPDRVDSGNRDPNPFDLP